MQTKKFELRVGQYLASTCDLAMLVRPMKPTCNKHINSKSSCSALSNEDMETAIPYAMTPWYYDTRDESTVVIMLVIISG